MDSIIENLNSQYNDSFARETGEDIVWKIPRDRKYVPFEKCPKSDTCLYCTGQKSVENWTSIIDYAIFISLFDSGRFRADELHKSGLCKLTILFRPLRPLSYTYGPKLKSGFIGCWSSHQYAAWCSKYVLNSGRTLIMEDDVNFIALEELPKVEKQLNWLDNNRPNWHIFYLGHFSLYLTPISISQEIWRTRSGEGHAYIISNKAAEKIGNNKWSKYHLDKNILKKAKGIDVYFAYHLDCYSGWKHIAVQMTQDQLSSDIGEYSNLFYRAHDFKSTYPDFCNYAIVLIYILGLILLIVLIGSAVKKMTQSSVTNMTFNKSVT